METSKQPELLAPARNIRVGITALEHGADAVYLGLQKHNARARGENFTLHQLGQITRYAHEINRKVYVALNTLIKEAELDDVAELISHIADIRPDGVMVQDLGIARLIRNYFPGVRLHASTQMGIHNSLGVNFLAENGFSRVILERQMPLSEIRSVARQSSIELEVFAHGALCCSLSGKCLFSSWLGGHSGNRGRCKQPCRRRYFSENGNGFFFSLKDLSTLEMLDEFEQMGIAGLKIEGRLQNADYVANVLNAYRKVLDTPPPERSSILKEARNHLAASLGRKWSKGFYAPDEQLVDHQRVSASGLLCGKVSRVQKNGIEIDVRRGFQCGDKLRTQPPSGDEGPVFPVSEIRVNNRSRQQCRKNERCFVPVKDSVEQNSFVYLVERPQPETSQRPEDLPSADLSVDLSIRVSKQGISITCGSPLLTSRTRHYPRDLPEPRKYRLNADDVVQEFSKCPPSSVHPVNIYPEISEEVFINKKQLRQIRQDFYAWLQRLRDASEMDTLGSYGLQEFRCRRKVLSSHTSNVTQPEHVVFGQAAREGKKTFPCSTIFSASLSAYDTSTTEITLPFFCPESKLSALKAQVQRCIDEGYTRFRLTAIHHIALLASLNLPDNRILSAGFPLPVANSLAFNWLTEHGMDKITLWLEIDKTSMKQTLDRVPHQRAEVYTKGRPLLLATRAQIPATGTISDQTGQKFLIKKTDEMTLVYPLTPFRIDPPMADVSTYEEMPDAEVDTRTETFNYERELV